MMRSLAFLSLLASTTTAFSARRALFRDAAVVATTTAVCGPALIAQAIDACPSGSKNCLRTAWKAPAGTDNVASELMSILSSYPKEGQSKVDLGGWEIVTDDLSGSSKSAKLEYTSGVGNFAKFFNGGKPFVDDLFVEITGGGTVEFKSASRIGESDLGVNQKRMQFLTQQARAKGWEAPDPVY